MKLFVVILNKTEKLEELLAEFVRIGICGSTVLQSTGAARLLSNYDRELPVIGSLRTWLYPEREKNKTILTVLRDDQVQDAADAVARVVGDITQKDTGIIFSVPIDFTKGLEGDCKT